jgi:protein-S-isoprenylcysteine O-methyltransferase Ste14
VPDERQTTSAQRLDMVAARLARMRVPLGFFCAGAVLWLARPTPRSLAIGGAIALAGEAIRVWAAGHLEKGREVTQSGPYRLTRHPLYAGSAIIAAGAAVATARAGAMALIAAYMFATIVSAIRHEEAGMRASFGDQYDAYAESRAAPVERPFSLARAMKNEEYKAIAGLAAVAAILAMKAFFGP